MIKLPKALIETHKRRREAHEKAEWRKPLSGDKLARWNEYNRLKNEIQLKQVYAPVTHERLLPSDLHEVNEVLARAPLGKVIHMKPHHQARSLSMSFDSNNRAEQFRVSLSQNAKIVRYRPNQPAMQIDMEVEKEVLKARLQANRSAARQKDQDEVSVIDILAEVLSTRSLDSQVPHAYDFEDPAERKPKKKYKLEGANFKANQPKEKEKPKDPKAHPDERIWRMARARKQAMFLLQCEDMEEEGWKLLVRGNSGTNYTVTVGARLSCSCPDFGNQKKPCKHLYYILNYVADAKQIIEAIPSSNLIQNALAHEILKRLRERLAYWVTPKEVIDLNVAHLLRNVRKMRGCQICFKRLGKPTNIQGCSRCKVRLHRACIKAFLEFGGVCPICKSIFERDDPANQPALPLENSSGSKPKKSKKEAKPPEVLMTRAIVEEDPLAFLDQ